MSVSRETIERFKVKDHSVSGETFALEYDSTRHMYHTAPKPDKEDLPLYYQSEDYISHTDGKRTVFEKAYQFVKRIALSRKQKLLKSYVPSKGAILDIGAGTGDFIAHLEKKGWDVSGIEPSKEARQLATKKGIELRASLDDFSKNFNAITMWHVLEHVYDLENQLKWLHDHLTNDGLLFIAVPNFESWDAKKYGAFWAAYDVPRHLYHFSQKSIRTIFSKYGLEVIDTHPMRLDAYYVSLLSEKYKRGKLNFLKAAYVGWQSNRYARKTGEYSSLTYVLKHKPL